MLRIYYKNVMTRRPHPPVSRQSRAKKKKAGVTTTPPLHHDMDAVAGIHDLMHL